MAGQATARARVRRTRERLLAFSLSLPGAYEDHPWADEAVAKVNGRIFVFFGAGEGTATIAIAVKLSDSLEQALAVPEAAPTGYGLGRAGWVTVPLLATSPPAAVLEDWIEESYRRVAPQRLVKELDAPGT
jgi:predicted DNA-binding protein (MmcQ/YjbR family)